MAQYKAAPLFCVSPWCNSVAKRIWDFAGAFVLLILLWPAMVVLAIAVKLSSEGPILFRQRRPGKDRREFTIFKFRTMVSSPEKPGPVLTRAADPRVTWLGRHMRKWKLDELPQLFNVVRGEMSFVGPRPQPTKLWRQPSIQEEASFVLSVRPGITSHATLNFRNEEELLAPLSPEEVEDVYMRHVLPLKLSMELEYLREASFLSDLGVVLRTVLRIFKRQEDINDGLIRQCLPAGVGSRSEAALQEKPQYESIAHQGD